MQSNETQFSLGTIMRQCRLKQGLSRRELASRSGITVQSLSKIETDRVNPRIGTMQSIANALAVPLEDLLPISGQRSFSGLDASPVDTSVFDRAVREMTAQMAAAIREILEGYAAAIKELHESYKSSNRIDS